MERGGGGTKEKRGVTQDQIYSRTQQNRVFTLLSTVLKGDSLGSQLFEIRAEEPVVEL